MSIETLKSMREKATQALSEMQNRVAPLLQEIERKKKEIALLNELLGLESGEGERARSEGPLPATRSSRKHNDVIEGAKKILAEIGTPLHVSELHRIFLERGFSIPGQGKEANLIAHLRRSPDIVRVKRGFYAIADGVVPQLTEPVVRQVRERHRRRRRRPSEIARHP